MDLTLLGWNARLARHAGDEASAKRYRDWANIVMPPAGSFGLDLRVTPASGKTALAGVDPYVFGLYAYRRPTPIDLLAPGLPHFALR